MTTTMDGVWTCMLHRMLVTAKTILNLMLLSINNRATRECCDYPTNYNRWLHTPAEWPEEKFCHHEGGHLPYQYCGWFVNWLAC